MDRVREGEREDGGMNGWMDVFREEWMEGCMNG